MESQANTFLSSSTLIAALIGFIAGAIVVWLMGRKQHDETLPKIEENPLQKPYDELQAEFKAYREKVNAHFSKTANAVDNLTKSYQEVFEHLSEGAQQLMGSEALKIEREKRQGKAITLAYLSDTETHPSTSTVHKETAKTEHATDNKPETKPEPSARVAPRPAEAAKPAAQPKSEKPANVANKTEPVIATSTIISTKEEPKAAFEEKTSETSSSAPINANNHAVEAPKAKPTMPETEKTAVIAAVENITPPVIEKEKTPAQRAAENVGLTANKTEQKVESKTEEHDPLSSVKRHLRENQASAPTVITTNLSANDNPTEQNKQTS